MSDALLTKIIEGIDALRADIKSVLKGGAAAAPTAKPAAAAPAAKPAAAAAAAKPAAAAAAKPAAAKPAAAGPAAGTKGPGGKYTIEQVRDIIRKVATNESLGGQSAKDILQDDGGGVTKVTDLKPENYDKVYEAAQVLLNGEGAPASSSSDVDDLLG